MNEKTGHRRVWQWVLMTVITLIWVGLPFWTIIVNSLKTERDAALLSIAPPREWAAFQNYATVLKEGNIVRGFLNTALYCGASLAIILLVGSLAAWILSRSTSPLVKPAYYVAISGVFVPPAIVTTIMVLKGLGLYGGRLGIILYYSAVYLPVAIFLMAGFVRNIPLELEEAARVDGARPLRVFFRIILPLLRPGLVTCFVLLFLVIWNDFISPFFFLANIKQWPLTVGLYNFASGQQFTVRWNLVFAHVVVVSLPAVIIFLFAQRQLISGLMEGARK